MMIDNIPFRDIEDSLLTRVKKMRVVEMEGSDRESHREDVTDNEDSRLGLVDPITQNSVIAHVQEMNSNKRKKL
jgi:hypothetical protein